MLTVAKFYADASPQLALSCNLLEPAEPAPWINPFIALGESVARFISRLDGRQLIVAINVPRRDFAAALIGSGWVMASAVPKLTNALEVLRVLRPDTPVRIVTRLKVVEDYFVCLDETKDPPRARFKRTQWHTPKIKAIQVLENLKEPTEMLRPSSGALGKLTQIEESWDMLLASPKADLAIVGTLKWLSEDMDALVLTADDIADQTETFSNCEPKSVTQSFSSLRSVLLPKEPKAATWFTRLYAGAKFEYQLSVPADIRAIVLDGAGATKHLSQIEVPVVVCVLDRSVADESAAEIVVQLRNSRGEPVSLSDRLGWSPPDGVEALAFTVGL